MEGMKPTAAREEHPDGATGSKADAQSSELHDPLPSLDDFPARPAEVLLKDGSLKVDAAAAPDMRHAGTKPAAALSSQLKLKLNLLPRHADRGKRWAR